MSDRTEQIFIGSVVALIGAVAGAIATAVVNLVLDGKININFWWVWILGGLFGAGLVFWLYKIYPQGNLFYGCKVALRTYDSNYVTADLNQDHQLFGRAKSIKAWQIFEIIDATMPFSQVPKRPVRYGDKIAFKALNNNKFVGANLDHDKELTTWVSHVQGWEIFVLYPTPNHASILGDVVKYGNHFALKAYNEKYVSYILTGDGRLLAVAAKIKAWETFVFINPKRPR